MDRLKQIYQELGEHICLYPFFGAFYQTNNVIPDHVDSMPNSVRPCSIVTSSDHNEWNIENQSIEKTRNNRVWKSMRKDFLDGRFHEIPYCKVCSSNEKSGTTSPRMMNNKFYSEFLKIDIVEEVRKIERNDNNVQDIITLDYYPSNYCNYACVMCAGGASSQRHIFEVRVLGMKEKITVNEPDPDFYQVIEKAEVINFTGGETVMQSQVHDIMDHLIEKDLAGNVVISLLTNGSSSPSRMVDKFRHFRKVVYNVSIDGVGEVIEYQRRNCKWPEVERHAIELMNHDVITCVINFVLTGINALNIMDFITWAYAQGFGPNNAGDSRSYITISPVFRVDHLGVAALPLDLRATAIERLEQGRIYYAGLEPTLFNSYFVGVIDRFLSIIRTTRHRPEYLAQFISHIRLEDSVSHRRLIDVVPEWADYF